MKKYRKKPVVIEAVQVSCRRELREHFPDPHDVEIAGDYDPFIGYIFTLEGRLFISPGDWIIRGVAGELYPCKPDVFEKTYEPA